LGEAGLTLFCSRSSPEAAVAAAVLLEDRSRHDHDVTRNHSGLESYVARLTAAEAIIRQFPTWCFGPPAMLKGFFDRMIMLGVAFDLSDPQHVKPTLRNIRRIVGIVTYDRPRHMAWWMSDPPRKIVIRTMRWCNGGAARADHHALYHLNVAIESQRARFIARVERAMRELAACAAKARAATTRGEKDRIEAFKIISCGHIRRLQLPAVAGVDQSRQRILTRGRIPYQFPRAKKLTH
jgi:NAD(P)H dehydrogenase (quinone)